MAQYKKYSDLAPADTVDNKNKLLSITSKEHKQQLILTYPLLVNKVYSDSCGPCKYLTPHFNKIAEEFIHKGIMFVSEDAMLGFSPNIKGVPTIEFFVKGKIYKDVIGADLNEIRKVLNELLTL